MQWGGEHPADAARSPELQRGHRKLSQPSEALDAPVTATHAYRLIPEEGKGLKRKDTKAPLALSKGKGYS